jgi:choline dehydrogenase-like flavoprotein
MSSETPRAKDGRAPDVFSRGGWTPMRDYALSEPVDFLIVGAGAGGATLGCRLAENGFSVVILEAGPFWRPLEDFASDELAQQTLFWTDDRLIGGDDPIALGGNNSGRGVGGSTVHYSMIALRFRPEWFKCRSQLGYGFDWPITYDDLAPYYEEAEEALKVAGPVNYPWGPPRRRYPVKQ